MTGPCFLVTVDTEGDNAWARPRVATTHNAAYLPRFQKLCESYGLRPTYLTNYEMARSPTFLAFGRDILTRGTAEIGMHLHAWDSPPLTPLTPDDRAFQPFLIEYPDAVMREKIRVLTGVLEDAFGVKMTSHRAGRWSFDERYAAMLVEEGYGVDCSVTPFVSWRDTRGAPTGRGGTDYTHFPQEAYWLDASDISQAGGSSLLEVPVTVLPGTSAAAKAAAAVRRLPPLLAAAVHPLRKALGRFSPSVRWLRPNGRNRRQLMAVASQVCAEPRGYAELALHSSELMPGGSPTFQTTADIEALSADLEALFDWGQDRFHGATLSEYRALFVTSRADAVTR